MFEFYLIIHVILCIWVLFFGGAKTVEGTWLAAIEFIPLANVREIKFAAFISLVLISVIYFV